MPSWSYKQELRDQASESINTMTNRVGSRVLKQPWHSIKINIIHEYEEQELRSLRLRSCWPFFVVVVVILVSLFLVIVVFVMVVVVAAVVVGFLLIVVAVVVVIEVTVVAAAAKFEAGSAVLEEAAPAVATVPVTVVVSMCYHEEPMRERCLLEIKRVPWQARSRCKHSFWQLIVGEDNVTLPNSPGAHVFDFVTPASMYLHCNWFGLSSPNAILMLEYMRGHF